MDTIPDLSEDVLSEELMKTKQKLKEITTALETQHMLLRLVVQVSTFVVVSFSSPPPLPF